MRPCAFQTRAASTAPGASTPAVDVELNKLDRKWSARWKEVSGDGKSLHPTKHLAAQDGGERTPFYCLSMFPYPSGMLHMGHLRVYTISDVVARFKRMQGYEVLHPMGWDAFGLPAENAARERGVDPAAWTELNISRMKEQMGLMMADFDWDREVSTCSPDYYRWTQKIFLLLHEHGLAYRQRAEINWDPVDQTVLANEQVDAEGRSWRSGALVEKRQLEQWFIGITQFAGALQADLDSLGAGWPDKVKTMQRHWIGESKGAEVSFAVRHHSSPEEQQPPRPVAHGVPAERLADGVEPGSSSRSLGPLQVFTSRPDTLFSVQFVALALTHPLVVEAAKKDATMREFIVRESAIAAKTTPADPPSKEGYALPYRVAVPLTTSGERGEDFSVPVYAAPYVLGSYGHGAVMGCPAHDQRDFDFWQKHAPEQDVVVTVKPKEKKNKKNAGPEKKKQQQQQSAEDSVLFTGSDGVLVDSLGKYSSLPSKKAGKMITRDLETVGSGAPSTQYRLRDWLVSRQRYWGAPIPIIHCSTCGPVPVPDKDLPVVLPEIKNTSQTFGTGGNPLEKDESFVNTTCPSCHGPAKRDTDTMDTFMDSSWYFFRYTDPRNQGAPFSPENATAMLPIDRYIGGVEHAILHLLYSRFISKFLGSIGMWHSADGTFEPIKQLVTQGMVHGKTYRDPVSGRVLKPEEIPGCSDPVISFEKMSKSKYNGADPAECIKKYGADATRAHMLFQAPLSDVLNWNEEQIAGIDRWLRRVVAMSNTVAVTGSTSTASTSTTSSYPNITLNGVHHVEVLFSTSDFNLFSDVQKTITSVTSAIDTELSFNTIISDYMKLTNSIKTAMASGAVRPDVIHDAYTTLLTLMAPVTPCAVEECYERLQQRENPEAEWHSIFLRQWPTAQEITSPFAQYNVFVNGKARFVYHGEKTLVDLPESEILSKVQEHEMGAKWIVGDVKKMIVKKGTLSFITGK
ncbi:leucine--tRNA ligase, mitochondrial [[Candida] anglica]|uniref:leucine--tRNA ligase n=1 Tax=[Candida] anglica TaxID=148631 RepID=A0ABP0E9E1_9ASCO